MGKVNEQWASKVLGVPRFRPNGPDLLNDKILIEVKSHMLGHAGKAPEYLSWTAHEHQVQYPFTEGFEGRTNYWALTSYRISIPREEVPEEYQVMTYLLKEK